MPTLTLALDHAGCPVIDLYVGVSAAARAALYEDRRPPASLLLRALVDTGASQTVVEGRYLEELGLDVTGDRLLQSVTTGTHPVVAKVYAVSLDLAGDVTGGLAADLEVVAVEDLSGLGVQALLGRDVLNLCRLHYDGPGRRISLSFPPFEAP